MSLPDPGLWALPDDLCCEVAAGDNECCPDTTALVRFATDLLVKAWGRRYSAGYDRITEYIAPYADRRNFRTPTSTRLDPRLLPLSGVVPWPVVDVESVIANGLSIPPTMWRAEHERRRVRSLPDPFGGSGALAPAWPEFPSESLDTPLRPYLATTDTPIDTATSIAVDHVDWGVWTFALPGFIGAFPACDSILLTNGTTTWEIPRSCITGASPTWTFTAAQFDQGSWWPYDLSDRLGVAQAWTAYRWNEANGWPGTVPNDTTITISTRTYAVNPAWQGCSMAVTYRAGMLPPSGPELALRLSCELRKLLCPNDANAASCGIPAGSNIRSISRQGLSLQLDDEQAAEGLKGWDPVVDAAIRGDDKGPAGSSGPVEVWAPSRADGNFVARRWA